MPSLLLLSGPNLNLLGTREPTIYGTATLDDHVTLARTTAEAHGFELHHSQHNHEGEIVDAVHGARSNMAGIVINPGAFTHTSIALHDAIKGVDGLPVIECHISNVHAREEFRHHSWVSPAASGIVIGFGTDGYLIALGGLVRKFGAKN